MDSIVITQSEESMGANGVGRHIEVIQYYHIIFAANFSFRTSQIITKCGRGKIIFHFVRVGEFQEFREI
ncbi:hypothetical protein QTP88_024264 [Uroleucon formosanum]